MKNTIKNLFPALAAASIVAACTTPSNDGSDLPYDIIEKTAIQRLGEYNERSFSEEVEFCGWVIELDGKITTTETVRGEFSSCRLPDPPRGSVLLASYHTHGNHTPDYASEFPSVVDIQGDFSTDLYGYVSTPGGRVWVVDPFAETVTQACGAGCVAIDPNYNEADYAYIPEAFTREMIFGFYGKAKGANYEGKYFKD